jgi:hypothetical protein
MEVFPTHLNDRFVKIIKNITVLGVPILGPILGPIFPLWAALSYIGYDIDMHMCLQAASCGQVTLSGAPSQQSWCNGAYAPTAQTEGGGWIYEKRDPGQETRYVYWLSGRWLCLGSAPQQGILGSNLIPLALQNLSINSSSLV